MRRLALWSLGLAATVFVVVQFWFLAHILWWTRFDPPSTQVMRAEIARLARQAPRVRVRQVWVPYARISTHLGRAVIAAEDARFTDHVGVDWQAIEDAYLQNLKRGRVVRGGSTITMQLAKNLFLSGERSYLRKAQELLITWMIEATMSKRRILEIYLNVAEWGVGVFGAEAAARHYFGVGASALEASQAARLAAMLPNPRHFDRHRDSVLLGRRARMIARGMVIVSAPR
ncbi:MAG: monofunctional biosynthetic peptidoglycan transglycosylase [Burkholderiaceae bacterium]|nr:monofunctional biosynthetic peptidoglycan transglycosylase [Burkholderiaceae bacterium]